MSREFEWIARFFRPLAAASPAGLELRDDAAVLTPAVGEDLVATADAMVAGVHFLADDPPGSIARKLLRVNLSDLAAMGARPICYLLTVCLPADIEEAWIEAFAAGLAEDQKRFAVALVGGDTTRTPGPMALSLTALGAAPTGRALHRRTAAAGDRVYVSGTIGDAALALAAADGALAVEPGEADRRFLLERLQLPVPRLELGRALLERALATAAIDVSDGLVADLGHIAEESALGAELAADRVPLSPPARRILEARPELLETVVTGGDDYELLFTVAPDRTAEIAPLAQEIGLPLTSIGVMKPGREVSVLDRGGRPLALRQSGWSHF